MRYTLFALLILCLFANCRSEKIPSTLGDPRNASVYGYTPIDPLPVSVNIPNDDPEFNIRIMNALPDETMRLAIGQMDNGATIQFGPAKVGVAGNNYVIVLDYIKYTTKSIALNIDLDTAKNKNIYIKTIDTLNSNNHTEQVSLVPVYVGVGLRMTASIHVKKGKVDLSNLSALGVAAESKKVTGTIVIQTLGISGKSISPLIPMPSEINTTTIQNAIMSLSAIKARMYEKDGVQLSPRVVGIYNNIGGGQNTVNTIISGFLSRGMELSVK